MEIKFFDGGICSACGATSGEVKKGRQVWGVCLKHKKKWKLQKDFPICKDFVNIPKDIDLTEYKEIPYQPGLEEYGSKSNVPIDGKKRKPQVKCVKRIFKLY